ncbi:MAG: TIR domain-containing protein [Desulfobacteraceae bacterium]|nr:TIR domain-containing protein [Desulfobacteraceae bacterium]
MTQKSKVKVFLWHAKEDSETAYRLREDLQKEGIIPWLYAESILPGQNWKHIIIQAIKESSYFLGLLSSYSVSKRGFIQKELNIALELLDEIPKYESFIIPIRLDECKLLDDRLKDIQRVDLFRSYEEGLKKILRAVSPQKSHIEQFQDQGEIFVKKLAEEMGCIYISADSRTHSISGYIQIFDKKSNGILNIAVKIKTGKNYIQCRNNNDKYILLNAKEIIAWNSSNMPTILVWVSDDPERQSALWIDVQKAKLNSSELKISDKFWFGSRSKCLTKWIELARRHAGNPNITVLKSHSLFPAKVSEVKGQAWEFYSAWREQGSYSPVFGQINITLKGWRHITRISSNQREVAYKLTLLPFAKELIEKATESYLLRNSRSYKEDRELYAIRGLHQSTFRAKLIVEVILEVVMSNTKGKKATLYSINERLH